MKVGVLRGVPWTAVTMSSALAALLMVPWVAWPTVSFGPMMLTSGFAILGAAAAFVLDEPSADAVDAGPTTRRQRSMVRSLALVLPLSVGLAAVAGLEARTPLVPARGLVLQVVGCVLLGLTAAAVSRSRGVASPGDAAASGVGLLLLVCAHLEPLRSWVLVFNLGDDPWWDRTMSLWAVLVVGCGCVLVVTTRDPLAGSARSG